MILIYVTCKDASEAKNISQVLLQKKLCACVNIFDKMSSMYFWAQGSDIIESSQESVLLIKTMKSHFSKISNEIKELHSYDVPCIFSIDVDQVENGYFKWLKNELGD